MELPPSFAGQGFHQYHPFYHSAVNQLCLKENPEIEQLKLIEQPAKPLYMIENRITPKILPDIKPSQSLRILPFSISVAIRKRNPVSVVWNGLLCTILFLQQDFLFRLIPKISLYETSMDIMCTQGNDYLPAHGCEFQTIP